MPGWNNAQKLWRRNDYEKYWNKKLAAKQTNKWANKWNSNNEKKNDRRKKIMNKSSRHFNVLWTRIQIFSYTLISFVFYTFCSAIFLISVCISVYVHFVHLPQSSFYFRFSVASRMTQKKIVFLPYLNVGFRLTENSEKLRLIRFMNDIKMKNANVTYLQCNF